MKVLIAGASGLVGTAAANAFAAANWQVVALSRRVPELIAHPDVEHLALDLQDPEACLEACRSLSDVTHLVYTAVFELPGLIQGWSDPQQIETNGAMLKNLLDPLLEHASLQHVSLLQGTKAYGAAIGPIRIPARESQPRVEHPNFYWLQEDYLKSCAATHGFATTLFRPQLIVGPNHGVVMNLPPVVGVYAAIRKAEGLPLVFPGGADWVWEATDARLTGSACLWATQTPHAAGETYNLTNGEVFSWRDMWPAIADTLNIEAGEDETFSIASYLESRSELWDTVVQRHGLQPLTLRQVLGESHHYADLAFAFGLQEPPPPTFVSTVKIRQAGFNDVYNSQESFCYWLHDLQRRKIIPA
ncbi:MAG: NAD-dependent epimerase/dehydratase family protein [Pseudomonadaceae bacterium]|nr:NAD-dependent epimerase/dehydratase family protein [Pseudomonadaceae bacterium]